MVEGVGLSVVLMRLAGGSEKVGAVDMRWRNRERGETREN